MIAANGLLEFGKRQRIGNKSFASGKIDGDVINSESFLIMKTQMSNGIEHDGNGPEIFGNIIIPCLASHECVLKSGDLRMKLNKEARINFPSTQDISWIARHAAGMIFPHPLQVVRIVTASFKLAGVPRPKPFALRAEHLITAFSFVNKNLAIGARFCVIFEKSDRSDGVGVANMVGIITCSLEFTAVCTGVFFTSGTFPGGRHEAIAIGISTAMDELIGGIGIGIGRIMSHQLMFGTNEINLEDSERLDLCLNVLDLIINVLDELVMSNSGLSGR